MNHRMRPRQRILAGLQAYYSFDRSLTIDDTAKGLTLTNSTGVTLATGKIGYAASFASASTQYLTQAAPWVSAFPMSISTWVNPSDRTTEYGIWGLTSSVGVAAYIRTTGEVRFTADAGVHTTTSSALVPTASWTHVVVTYDGTTANIWINGALDPNSGTLLNSGSTFDRSFIGARGTGNEPFNGMIDEVGAWNRALSAGEIAWIYNGGSGRAWSEYGVP